MQVLTRFSIFVRLNERKTDYCMVVFERMHGGVLLEILLEERLTKTWEKREKSRESRLIERKSMYEQKIWNSREKMREILKIETEEREREKLGRNCWDRSWRVEISERKKLKKEFPKPPKTPPPISVSSCIEFYIKNLFVSPFLARFISTKRKKVCKTNKVCLTLDFCVYDLFVCALLDLFT